MSAPNMLNPYDPFDLTPYVRPPRLSTAGGVVTSIRLIKAAPKDLSARARDALEGVRGRTVSLQAIGRDRLRVTPETMRPADAALDAGWVGFRESLEALARLVGTPEGDRAAYLLPRVLPRRTEFVRFTYEDQWHESENIITRIDEDGLASELDGLIGPVYLAFIRRAHAAYGEALGLGERALDTTEKGSVADALAAVSFAIAEYTRIMVGELDRRDPASVARFKRAMAPLDAARARVAVRRVGTDVGLVGPTPTDDTDVDTDLDVEPVDDDVIATDPIPLVPEPGV